MVSLPVDWPQGYTLPYGALRAGRLPKEFNFVNAIDCRNENTLYVGEIGNLRVQKITLH